MLNCITEIIQVAEGHKHFRGPHIGQPCVKRAVWLGNMDHKFRLTSFWTEIFHKMNSIKEKWIITSLHQ